jgi:hypothetical protein
MASVYTRSIFGFFDFFVDEFEDARGAGLPVNVSWRVAGLCMLDGVRMAGIAYGIGVSVVLKARARRVTRLFCHVLLRACCFPVHSYLVSILSKEYRDISRYNNNKMREDHRLVPPIFSIATARLAQSGLFCDV